MIDQIADGRTDLVFDYMAAGHPATSKDKNGTSFLGDDLGLNGAAFHRHWRLCQCLIENGADVNSDSDGTGETPLHSALSSPRAGQHLVAKVLPGERL